MLRGGGSPPELSEEIPRNGKLCASRITRAKALHSSLFKRVIALLSDE